MLGPTTLIGFTAVIACTVAANLMLKLGAGVPEAERILFGVFGWKSAAGLALFGCGGIIRGSLAPGAAQPRTGFRRSAVCRGRHRRKPGARRADFAGALARHCLYQLRHRPGRPHGASLSKDRLTVRPGYSPARRAARTPLVREMRSTTRLGSCLTSVWRSRQESGQ